MKIQLNNCLSQEGQRDSLRQGGNGHAIQSVELEADARWLPHLPLQADGSVQAKVGRQSVNGYDGDNPWSLAGYTTCLTDDPRFGSMVFDHVPSGEEILGLIRNAPDERRKLKAAFQKERQERDLAEARAQASAAQAAARKSEEAARQATVRAAAAEAHLAARSQQVAFLIRVLKAKATK